MSIFSQEILADNPLWYLRLGETSGAFQDSSPNNHDGTLQGSGSTRGVTGLVDLDNDAALHLSGTAQEAVAIGDFDVTGSAITVMAIVIPGSATQSKKYVGKHNATGDVQGTIGQNSSKHTFEATTGGTYHLLSGTSTPSTTKRQIVHGVYDGSNMRIYVDGVQENSVAASGNLANNAWNWFIGGIGNGSSITGSGFLGDVDEAAVFASALSPERIKAHVSAMRAQFFVLSLQPSGVDDYTTGGSSTDAGTAHSTLTPSGVEEQVIDDAATESLALTPTAVEEAFVGSFGTLSFVLTPDAEEFLLTDVGQENLKLTPSAVEVKGTTDLATEYLDLQPSGVEAPQYPLVEVTTVPITFTLSAIELKAHEYTDAVGALLTLTATGLEIYCRYSPQLSAEAFSRFGVENRSRMAVLEDIHWEFDVLEGVDPCLPPVEAFLV